MTDLTSLLFFGNTLSAVGDRWEAKYFGTFAENNNEKRITFNVAGGRWLDSGTLESNGEAWELTVTLYRTGAASHNAVTKLETPSKTIMKHTVANLGVFTTIGLNLAASGAQSNDVVLQYGHESFHPAP